MLNTAICTREFHPHTNFGEWQLFTIIYHNHWYQGVHVEIFTQGIVNETITFESGVVVHYVTVNRLFQKSKLHGNSRKCFSKFCYNLGKRLRSALVRRGKMIQFDFIEVHEHMGIGAALPGFGNSHKYNRPYSTVFYSA